MSDMQPQIVRERLREVLRCRARFAVEQIAVLAIGAAVGITGVLHGEIIRPANGSLRAERRLADIGGGVDADLEEARQEDAPCRAGPYNPPGAGALLLSLLRRAPALAPVSGW